MRRLVLTALVGTSLSLSACGKSDPAADAATPEPVKVRGFDSSEALAKSVVDGLTKKDKAAFKDLYATVDEALDACPKLAEMGPVEEIRAERAKEEVKIAAQFEECAKIDFSKAKIVSIKGGEIEEAEKDCPKVHELKDIEVELDLGSEKRTVIIDDPMKLGDRMFLWDELKCELTGAAEVVPVPPAGVPADPPAGTPPPVANSAPTPAATGSATCDKFLAAYETCVAAMPPEAIGAARDGLKSMKEQFSKIDDKTMLDGVCTQAYDSAKRSMGTFCPNAFP